MSYQSVMRLSRDPKVVIQRFRESRELDWLEVLRACYEEAQRLEGRSFEGSAVSKKVGWFPGLTKLARYGILQRDDRLSNRKGAWWFMRDVDGVGRALRELGYL